MSDTTSTGPEGTDAEDQPDLGTAEHDHEGTTKPGGLGDDATIPDAPGGIATGFSETDSHFNPEEDAPAE
jgi:hypothetical protein